MSNERIDLKQFEGHDEGPWEASEPSEVIYGAQKDKGNWPVLAFYPPRGKEKNGWWGDRIPAMHANLKLMAAGPELIAELKRCYDLIDRLTDPKGVVLCPECGEITDDQSHHQYCTASE
jgi:hypothetical protein